MKFSTKFFTLLLCLFFNSLHAQKTQQCAFCNMEIHDEFHKASLQEDSTTLKFDSSECLINYIKAHHKSNIHALKVANFKTGEYIYATEAFYLISESIPSPMGANLSAFKTKEEAVIMQKKKGGNVYSWEAINTKFKTSKIGTLSHHNHHNHYRPDAHAPIGVMGDHLHAKGGLMVSFRYMNMVMDGNKEGTQEIDNTSIYNDYMVAPQNMTMDMYMLGIMYAPSDCLTLMIMQNLVQKNMSLTAKMMMNGMTMMQDFSTSSSAFGDLQIGAIYGLFNNNKTSLHLNGSINLPLGDITNSDDTPMMNNSKLPYSMQSGSGTFDITLGATFKRSYTNMSFGTQYLSTFRTGINSENYRFGNKHQLNVWSAFKLSTNFSISARIQGVIKTKIKGIDSDLNPMMVTNANINNYGSEKIKSHIGLNISFPQTSNFKRFRFGFEAGTPIYEHYNGVQMNENLSINAGLKYDIL